VTAVLDFGWYRMPDGRRSLLSWYSDCGVVVLDGPAGLEVLGFVADETDVRRRLEGWEEVANQPAALAWARARVAGRTEHHGEVNASFRPVPAGGGPAGPAP